MRSSGFLLVYDAPDWRDVNYLGRPTRPSPAAGAVAPVRSDLPPRRRPAASPASTPTFFWPAAEMLAGSPVAPVSDVGGRDIVDQSLAPG